MFLTGADLTYFWLGPVGRLRRLPLLPVGGRFDADEELVGGLRVALDGTATLDVMGHRRTWRLEWACLEPDEVGPIRAHYLGLSGAALRLIDPRARNRLTRDGSSGGSYSRDTGAFTADAGELAFAQVADYPSEYADQLDGGVVWSVPAAVAADLLIDDALRIPLVPGETLTVSVLLKGSGDASVGLRFYDPAGDPAGDDTASAATLSGWAWFSHTVTPTDGQVAASVLVAAASGDERAVTVGPAQVESGAEATGWVPGSGCPVVLPTDMTTTYPGLAHSEPGLTLREV